MTSIFGAAFDKLPRPTQQGIIRNLQVRRVRYGRAMQGIDTQPKVVLLGDTPGPSRPTDPSYHHTPFYSTKHSSLWINKLLLEAGVDENSLTWFNTTLADGRALDYQLFKVQAANARVICLGGNAEKWLNGRTVYEKVHHPQAWKRFHSDKRYPLLDLL